MSRMSGIDNFSFWSLLWSMRLMEITDFEQNPFSIEGADINLIHVFERSQGNRCFRITVKKNLYLQL